MRAPLVAGNWKMNGDTVGISSLLEDIRLELKSVTLDRCQVLVLPPYVYLPLVIEQTADTDLGVGAQEVDARDAGAVTGGVSAAMVREMGCDFSLVGHSERRTLFGETDEHAAAKCERCLEVGLTPILCVGETLDERKGGLARQVVERQFGVVADRLGAAGLGKMLLAYEPVWAIGTGESATPELADEVHRWLREAIATVDASIASEMRILYGGSVTAGNAAELFGKENIDGALVGGASLKGKSFVDICRAAEES